MITLSEYFYSFISFAIIIPGAFLCYSPMVNQLKISFKKLSVITSIIFICYISIAAFLDSYFELNPNSLLIPSLLIFFIFYYKTLKTSFWKALYVFTNSISLSSFATIISYLVESQFKPTGSMYDNFTYGLIVQYVCELSFIFILWPFTHTYLKWLIDYYFEDKIWKIIWILPLIYTFSNVMLIPLEYNRMHIGKIMQTAIVLVSCSFITMQFCNMLFYHIAQSNYKRTQLLQENQLLQIQTQQYKSLKEHMLETRRIRHDFKQSIAVMVQLAADENFEQLTQYLQSYNSSLNQNTTLQICANYALNAILNYYNQIALANQIQIHWKIDTPETFPISETEICSIIGNLFENAIGGCKTIPSNRHIYLSCDVENNAMLFIVITNTFNGQIKKDNRGFHSTKHKGYGIGLASITSIVNHYHGVINIKHTQTDFTVDIFIPFTQNSNK